MFNLLCSASPDAWDQGVYEFPRDRVFEYTDASIEERYKDLKPSVLDELKSFPTLFCIEGDETPARVGYITNIRARPREVRIDFRFDDNIRKIRRGAVRSSSLLLDLGRLELNRTHWAIKDGDLWAILTKIGVKIPAATKADFSRATKISITAPDRSKRQVFIVHGHDNVTKYEMAEELRTIGCEPVILHEQASGGMTIIEKIEAYTNVGFAVVLYTPCDVGGRRTEEMKLTSRARQNVVFEHGYLIGKLGRSRVIAFVRGRIETPSDISGVVYVAMDDTLEWKAELKKELKAVGY